MERVKPQIHPQLEENNQRRPFQSEWHKTRVLKTSTIKTQLCGDDGIQRVGHKQPMLHSLPSMHCVPVPICPKKKHHAVGQGGGH